MQILGPFVVFRLALDRDARGAAIAPVVDDDAMTGLGDLLGERSDPRTAAPTARLQRDERATLAEGTMLTEEENALLTQTGRGTPMGDLLRRYWQPVAAASEMILEGLWAHRRIGRSEERGYYAEKQRQPEPREPGSNRPPRRGLN